MASQEERFFAVGELLRPGTKTRELSYDLDLEIVDLDLGLVPKGRFQAFLTLRRVGDSIGALLIEGKLPVELQCLRCLTSFAHALSLIPTERYFYPPGRMPATEEGEQFFLAEGGKIDISEMLRQEIMLALPAYSLCSSRCQGICACCGRQAKQCSCSPRPKSHPRPLHQPLADLPNLWRRGKGKGKGKGKT